MSLKNFALQTPAAFWYQLKKKNFLKPSAGEQFFECLGRGNFL